MGLLEAILLGIIQGLTEFLPVSSSGHLELAKAISEATGSRGLDEDNLLFTLLLHAATALSTIVVYRKDILELLKGLFKFKWNTETQFSAKILLSMIPITVVGFAFKDQIESLFGGHIMFVGFMLIVTGGILLFSDRATGGEGEVTYKKSILIGLAQAVAILPGISRSGTTIATSLILGVSRERAARFSFLMVLPPIMGATLLELKDYLEAPAAHTGVPVANMAAGVIAAFLAGLLACTWMIKLVQKSKLSYFAIYCAIAGLVAIGLGQFV